MTVRFKCQTEYQRSYRSSSVSPQRCALQFAGLRSDHMGITREPCLQRRKKLVRARSCGPPHEKDNEPVLGANLSKSPAVLSVAESQAPPEPPHAEGLSEKPLDTNASPAISDQFAIKSQKPSRNSSTIPNQQSNHRSLRRKAGLGSRGHRLGLDETEYNQQFHVKKGPAAPSPILSAHQVLYSSVPPYKKHPVAMETEYQRCFQGLAPPKTPHFRKNQEQEQTALFYTLVRNNKNLPKKKTEAGLKNEVNRPQSFPKQESRDLASPNLRKHRKIQEEEDAVASRSPQVKELREQALSYRRRAWGTNFSRDHLSQLLSEHNALWEPTETIDSTSVRPQSTALDLCQVSSAQANSGGTSCVEALDLASSESDKSVGSKKSSAVDSEDEEIDQTNTLKSPTLPQSCQSPLVEKQDGSDGNEEGRLPTPKLKMLPVQRTHLDVTTPATGGAVLVGQLKGPDEASVIPRTGTADSVLAKDSPVHMPGKPREAWTAESDQLKPVSRPGPSQSRAPVASAFPLPPPLHCIHGTLRHADFQHNGELGLRFKEQKCTRGCCGSDEDDRLSVMSWRSAASCSLASVVLERAQKRRDDFWGKR